MPRRELDWNLSDRFYSNGGRGPLVARILCIAGGVATMERKHVRAKRWIRFTTTERYLMSKRCGWKLRRPAHDLP